MRPILVPLSLLALAGCAAGGAGLAEREHAALERELAGRVAGEPRSCVPAGVSQGLQVVSDRAVVYRAGGTVWVNRPAQGCTGLRPLTALIVGTSGRQYCRGDHVRTIDLGLSIPGSTCVLGDFVPYREPARS